MEPQKVSAREEFEHWLRVNGRILVGQTTSAVADIAIANGQDITVVRQWQTHRRFEEIEKTSNG